MRGRCYNRGGDLEAGVHYEVDRAERRTIARAIREGRSVHVTGGRRLGKTVLLQQVLEELSQAPAIIVSWDLTTLGSRLASQTFFQELGERVTETTNDVLHRSGKEPLSSALSSTTCSAFTRGARAMFRELDEKQIGGLPLVVLLDECDSLLSAPEPAMLLGEIRSIVGFETRHRVKLMVSGFRRLYEYRDEETNTSPFLNIIDPIVIGAFDRGLHDELAAPLLDGRSEDERAELSERLWAASGGHPCITQCLAGELLDGARWDDASAAATTKLSQIAFNSWADRFTAEDHARFDQLIEGPLERRLTDSDAFFEYCGVAKRSGSQLVASSGLFNDWYRNHRRVTSVEVRGPIEARRKWDPHSEDEPADIAIITIIDAEYHAVSSRLPEPSFYRARDGEVNTHAWQTAEIERADRGGAYRVVLAMAGRGGQAPATTCTLATIRRWRPQYVLVVGIAGGFHRDGLQKGDVALSQCIYAYQYGSLRDGKFQPRHDFMYRPDGALWTSSQAVDQGWSAGLELPEWEHRTLKVCPGNIASGDLLVDDVSSAFWKEVENAWERLLAVEMEGAGVAASVAAANTEMMNVGFMMVRGISDMPPPPSASPAARSQSTERELWKKLACDAAAAFTIHWIRTKWPR